ncbi:suppressor of cytokine signaling 2-like [Centruroides vittatus]|uniref:suppressor of cytokine signaling 2-like n=1 Tax=Centruroides vittatus TaxID=120091 RepID=UPI00350F4306
MYWSSDADIMTRRQPADETVKCQFGTLGFVFVSYPIQLDSIGSKAVRCQSSRSHRRPDDMTVDRDFQRITRTLEVLNQSGYYYEGLSWQKAADVLKNTSVGTFLVRPSSDSKYLFALSVQTDRGPTSVRIHYLQGQFRLDSEDCVAHLMPLFECVVQLVEYYVQLTRSVKASSCVLVDGSGRRDVPIRLCRPLYRHVRSLQHLCRLRVNGQLVESRKVPSNQALATDVRKLDLPNSVKSFLREYPYVH